VSRDGAQREDYVNALLREIESRATSEYNVDTVYFGGGTPSLLSAEQIGRILKAIRENFSVCEDAEITLECNPMTHLDDGKEYFSALRELGINRLSIGVQSAISEELRLIGRHHSFEDAKRTVLDARESGFDNISLDLMFGIPSQTIESLKTSIEALVSLEPEHISIYSLQLEEGTPLYRMREKYDLADDDMAAEMYELVVSRMRNYGYCHYEISNFAREGRESRHNSKYWALDEYLGMGLAAHSDIGGKRIENTKDMARYLDGKWVEGELCISKRERELEFIMLGLRTARGISKSEFLERFGTDFDEKYAKRIEKFKKAGYFCEEKDFVALNERGFEVSNAILSEILDFDY
jgi:oxygen-independent coproporphyrinogen-3 oxidase